MHSPCKLLIILYFLCFSGILSAQENDIDTIIISIRGYSTPCQILKFESENGMFSTDLMLYDRFRHEMIIKLDDIFDEQYNWSADRYAFEGYLNNIKDQENKAAIEELVQVFGDSISKLFLYDINKKTLKKYKDSLHFRGPDMLFRYLQLDRNIYNQSIIEANVSFIRNHNTLRYLNNFYQEQIKKPKYDHVAGSVKSRNHKILKQSLADIEEKKFVYYKSSISSRKAFKEIDVFMDNDIFTPGKLTTDHEYTGGGMITLSTDYLSSKWLSPGWLKYIGKGKSKKSSQNFLSYQSVSFGLTSFTPYIRYRNNYELADTLFQHDRPFSSYIYFDLSKYRLWPKGLIRHHGALQLGVIGTMAGSWMQGTLHKVYGWEKQIANGGRWLIQLNHSADFLLLSSTNKYRSVFRPHIKNRSIKNFGLNLYGTGEILWGGYLSSLGGGFTLSSSDFIKQSGQRTIKPLNNKFEFGLLLNASIKYRYILHNSMLEGYGYWTTFVDEIIDDDSELVYTLNLDYYKMQNKQINKHVRRYERTPKGTDDLERNIFILDLGLNLRFRKMTIYYQLSFYSKEYKDTEIDFNGLLSLVKNEHHDFYTKTVIPDLENYRRKDYYGFGRIGVSWLLGN